MTEKELHKLINESVQSLTEKKLCPKGKAYYNRRIAAGEVPSAYLSGRAVKVCKGLMEGDEQMIDCEECGWEWSLEDGGKEPFVCHKCGHDNTEKYDMNESLRDWFKKEDWVRIDTQGNITGDCGTMKKGQATTRCLPRAKANRLTKDERAATARKKAAADREGDRVVPNTDKAKVRFREGFAHEMSNSDFDKMTNILNDKSKADQIHSLLVQMFSNQKELLDYNYKNDSYAEFKRFIHGIENYSLEGPTNIPYTDLKLDPEVYAERDKKYNDYVEGKIDRYFRDTNSDPRKLDLSKAPPITIDENGEIMDGNHRAFLAIKQQKPLKGYKIVAKQNSHPNVQKILNLINNEIKESKSPLGWEKYIKSETEEIERTAEDLGLPFDVTYNAFVNGKEVTLTDEIWSRLENTDSYDINSEEEAIELAQHYGKDWQSIVIAEKTPPALILQYSPNKYYLVGGNTRLMFARVKGENPQVILGTIEPSNKFAYQDVNDIGADLNEDCGCNGPKLILKEIKNLPVLSEGMLHHIKEGLPLTHNIFRPLSKKYFELFREARELYNNGLISVSEDDIELMESGIGEIGVFEGINVPLDYPLSEEELITEAVKAGKKVAIGKPKRGGSKKFYVYVKAPGGKVKKVSFGMAGGGLRAKLNNPAARRAFAARHDCKNKKDRTKASYWSCRLPRYAKLLGFKTTFSGFW